MLLNSCLRGIFAVCGVGRLALTGLICVMPLIGPALAQPALPPSVKPQIARMIAHDPAAFTQGLLMVDTLLYESTGLVGRSSLRRVSPNTGEALTVIPVRDVFAEGIAVRGGELVQLTWQNGIAIRYDFPSLQRKSAVYRYSGEGWGLTADSAHFIMSNGTDTLYWRGDDFAVVRKLPVTYGGRPLAHINELEYARGHVYANVWYRNFIAQISVTDGRTVRTVDCSELLEIEKPRARDDVLNGIAYCERENLWYLTGKNWRYMFVVRIPD